MFSIFSIFKKSVSILNVILPFSYEHPWQARHPEYSIILVFNRSIKPHGPQSTSLPDQVCCSASAHSPPPYQVWWSCTWQIKPIQQRQFFEISKLIVYTAKSFLEFVKNIDEWF